MRPTIRAIAEEVGARHGVTLEEMQSDTCVRRVTTPRQEAYYLAREAGHGLSAIARLFCKEHTTITYGVKAHCDRADLAFEGRDAKVWPDAQIAAIRDNPSLGDVELAPLVNAVGPERTSAAIGHARRKLGIKRVQSAAARSEGGKRGAELNAGWPAMPGSDEARDAEFALMVLRGWAELQGLQVAA